LFVGVNPPVACNPDWSCLPLKEEFRQTTGSVRRVSVSDGSSRVIAPKVGVGWPGLAADGSMLAYTDTGSSTRVIVADTNGRALHSFQLVGRQTMEGWLGGATLVFSDRGDIRRVRSYSFNDEKVRLLVDSLEQFTDPVWSPDGALLAGASCSAARCELRVGRADGSLVKLIPLPDRYAPGGAWSPDQRWVAYVGGPPNGERHVNVVDVSTGQVQQLSTVRSPTVSVIWSADSREITVSSTVGGTGAGRRVAVERIGYGGGQPRMLREVALGATPSSGNAISATAAVVLRAGELKRVALEGDSSETVLIPKLQARYAGFFTASPKQDRLAFRRTRDGDLDGDFSVLEVVNVDGSGRTTIDVPFPMLNGPSALRFLPDGKQLIATALPSQDERNIAVYLVTVETKAVKKLFTIPIFSFTNDLTVSPDGRTILYVVNETTTPRVFTMDLSSLRADSRK